jgi:hypothetical protein
MNPLYTSVLAIFVTVTIPGMLTKSTQQVFATRECGGCGDFKKLTSEFEKDVLEAAVGDPNIIPDLVEKYSRDVLELFSPSTNSK